MVSLGCLLLKVLPLLQLWQKKKKLSLSLALSISLPLSLPLSLTCLLSGKEMPYILCSDSAWASPFQYVDEFCKKTVSFTSTIPQQAVVQSTNWTTQLCSLPSIHNRLSSNPRIGCPTYGCYAGSLDLSSVSHMWTSTEIYQWSTSANTVRFKNLKTNLKFIPIDCSGGCGYLLVNDSTFELIVLLTLRKIIIDLWCVCVCVCVRERERMRETLHLEHLKKVFFCHHKSLKLLLLFHNALKDGLQSREVSWGHLRG